MAQVNHGPLLRKLALVVLVMFGAGVGVDADTTRTGGAERVGPVRSQLS